MLQAVAYGPLSCLINKNLVLSTSRCVDQDDIAFVNTLRLSANDVKDRNRGELIGMQDTEVSYLS